MIIIDGRHSEMKLTHFTNLEEVLLNVIEDASMQNRIVTDVFVNEEQFTEIYPHQAEDIQVDSIERIEVRSVSAEQMTVDIVGEMSKVVQIMSHGGKHIALMFRQADDVDALELFQDLLDVTRDFLGMIVALSSQLNLQDEQNFKENSEKLSTLLFEMTEVLESEDWILLADLLEYEFLPLTEGWSVTIAALQSAVGHMIKQ